MTRPDDLAVYLDASALTKLVLVEPESSALIEYIGGRLPMSSDVVLAEVPRAVRAIHARTAMARPLQTLLRCVDDVFDQAGFVTSDMHLFAAAAMLDPPTLRTLDAIHVATAKAVAFEEFVTYDERQAAAARLAGLRTVSPGA